MSSSSKPSLRSTLSRSKTCKTTQRRQRCTHPRSVRKIMPFSAEIQRQESIWRLPSLWKRETRLHVPLAQCKKKLSIGKAKLVFWKKKDRSWLLMRRWVFRFWSGLVVQGEDSILSRYNSPVKALDAPISCLPLAIRLILTYHGHLPRPLRPHPV